IARATSSGVVRRPLGLRRRATSLIVSWPGIFWRAGVSVTPARIEFAVIPRGASSEASCRMWDSRAALAAETGPYWGSTRAPPDARERRLAVEVHAEDVEAGASAREAHRLAEARGGAEDQRPAAERDRRRTHVSAPTASVSASSAAPAHRSRRAPPSAARPTRKWKAARPRKKSVRSMPTRLSTSRPRASPIGTARAG